MQPRGSLDHTVHPQGLSLPSPHENNCACQASPWWWQRLLKLHILSSAASFVFPVNSFGEVFFLCNSLCVASFLSSFSLWSGLPPLYSTPDSFLPKSHLCTSYLPQHGLFSPSHCAVFSLSPSDQFLGCPDWFDIYQLSSRDETRIGSPCYSTILTPIIKTIFFTCICIYYILWMHK